MGGGALAATPMTFQSLRGFRDYLPTDAAARRKVQETIRALVRRYGFEEVETPSLESLDLIKAKSGDAIVEETFCFTDKGGREVTLVPENTPSLARLYSERAKIEPLPVKWAAFPRLWRYEEPQAGRLREFGQLSLDIFGVPGAEAEIELLEVSRAVMDALGLEGRYAFRLSDRRVAEGLGKALGAKETGPFFRALDRRSKMSAREFSQELERAGIPSSRQTELSTMLERTSGGVRGAEARKVLQEVRAWPGLPKEALDGFSNLEVLFARTDGTPLSRVLALDLSLVRGLAYYTSTVFEAWALQGEIRALFGGGRYDRLIELFGGGNVPACGLAMGDITLELLLREAKLWPERPPGLDAYVATVDPSLTGDARALVGDLRAAGLSADRDLLERSLSRQMKEASRRGARTLVLLGPREKEKGEATLRSMRTGRQDVVSWARVVERVRSAASEPEPSSPSSSPP